MGIRMSKSKTRKPRYTMDKIYERLIQIWQFYDTDNSIKPCSSIFSRKPKPSFFFLILNILKAFYWLSGNIKDQPGPCIVCWTETALSIFAHKGIHCTSKSWIHASPEENYFQAFVFPFKNLKQKKTYWFKVKYANIAS